MILDRRYLLRTFSAAFLLPFAGAQTKADDAFVYPLKDDGGAPLPNYRLPSQLSTDDLPGVLWTGSEAPDVTVVEFFDYNCPYCRKAVKEIDALVEHDRDFRLGLVNNSILSPGSAQAAKVLLAVEKLKGPKVAYGFHLRLLGKHGPVDGTVALQLAAEIGLDRKLVESTGDSQAIGAVLHEQNTLAASLGFAATPSFMIDGIGILGYPGVKTMSRIVAAVRRCDRIMCS
ncbi:MAG: DsbA family protein [Hyphomicrobiales bacterium]